ncbi:sorting nexin-7-like isoform X2 [Apostichopus japonicus]|uniref:sorting nexin-7-like isoform X2 n=1 Tax=Stichopus japonicus TaxID=307972 RepID=UPI003AB6A07E
MADSGPKDDSENGSISETMKEAFANPLTDDDDEEEEILATVLASTLKENQMPDLQRLAINSLSMDDQDTHDVFITVDDPRKHVTKMETYATYKVSTKTTRGDFDQPEYSLRRRYTDFLWLRQKLEETQPTHLVPPLPEKHSMKLDRFGTEFLTTRQRALNKFMTRISEHPTLSFNEYFKIFLTAKAWELSSYRKQSPSVVFRLGSSVKANASAYMLKNRSPEYTMMGEYVHTFGDKMGSVDRISQRILKEQIVYQEDLTNYGPAYRLWSDWEVDLSDILNAFASSIDKCAKSMETLIQGQELYFVPLIKEYMLYAESVKTVLKKRDLFQVEYELAVEEITRKKNEREQVKISDQNYSIGAIMGKDPQEVKEEKGVKLETQIEKLQTQVEFLNDKTECANADLKADVDRWHRNKRKDTKDAFIGMAGRHITYYENMLSAWEDVMHVLRDLDIELPEPPQPSFNNPRQESQNSSSESKEDSWVKVESEGGEES